MSPVDCINLILNLAGLLLWLSWLSLPFDPLAGALPSTLPGTLRRAAPVPWKKWHFLAGLGVLLFVRAFFYWKIGGAIGWTARLDLEATAIPFQSDFFRRMFVFSILSFLHTLALFYLWLIFFVIVNQENDNLVQKFARQLLGRAGRWPRWALFFLPMLVAVIAWAILSFLLEWMAIIPSATFLSRLEQGALLGISSFLSWKILVGLILLLYIINSYIYLGKHPVWDFVNLTARRLMKPLQSIPLELGKADFTPLVAMLVVFLVAGSLERGWHFTSHPEGRPARTVTVLPSFADIYRTISR